MMILYEQTSFISAFKHTSIIHTYIHTFLHICTNPSNLLSYQAMEHRGSGDGHAPPSQTQTNG